VPEISLGWPKSGCKPIAKIASSNSIFFIEMVLKNF
jgi:hypothetical protein